MQVLTELPTTRKVEEIVALKAHIEKLIRIRHAVYVHSKEAEGMINGMSEALQWVLGADTKGIEIVKGLK